MALSYEERIRRANEELLGKGNLEVVNDVFADDYVVHAGDKKYHGHKFIIRFVRQLRAAMPDLRVVEVTPIFRAGKTMAWQRTLRGTHKAGLKGIPPSGRKVTWTEMLVSRFDGGKIAEEWAVSDLAGQLMLKLPRA